MVAKTLLRREGSEPLGWWYLAGWLVSCAFAAPGKKGRLPSGEANAVHTILCKFSEHKPNNGMPCGRGTVNRGHGHHAHDAAMCSLSWTKLPVDHRRCQPRARPRDTTITLVANFKRSLRLSIRIGDKNSGAINVQQTGSRFVYAWS
jgi:hypothetical protein